MWHHFQIMHRCNVLLAVVFPGRFNHEYNGCFLDETMRLSRLPSIALNYMCRTIILINKVVEYSKNNRSQKHGILSTHHRLYCRVRFILHWSNFPSSPNALPKNMLKLVQNENKTKHDRRQLCTNLFACWNVLQQYTSGYTDSYGAIWSSDEYAYGA